MLDREDTSRELCIQFNQSCKQDMSNIIPGCREWTNFIFYWL